MMDRGLVPWAPGAGPWKSHHHRVPRERSDCHSQTCLSRRGAAAAARRPERAAAAAAAASHGGRSGGGAAWAGRAALQVPGGAEGLTWLRPAPHTGRSRGTKAGCHSPSTKAPEAQPPALRAATPPHPRCVEDETQREPTPEGGGRERDRWAPAASADEGLAASAGAGGDRYPGNSSRG